MVQGLGFLSKKSWHTKNLANQEKVWMAEQQKEAEAAKTKELAKQIQQEREQEEMERISGKKKSAMDRGIDWMYQGGNATGELAKEDAEKRAEEYLLGKEFVGDGAITGDFDNGDQKQGINSVIPAAAAAVETEKISEDDDRKMEPSVKDRNENFRLRVEDPMFQVSQKQREKEVKHEKTKALYERVVGPQGHSDDDDNNDDENSDSDRKSKKHKKSHKKKKHHESKSSSSRRRHHRSRSRSASRDRHDKRRKRSRSYSVSRSRSRSRSRSPSEDSRHDYRHDKKKHRHERSHRSSRYDDDDDHRRHHNRHRHHDDDSFDRRRDSRRHDPSKDGRDRHEERHRSRKHKDNHESRHNSSIRDEESRNYNKHKSSHENSTRDEDRPQKVARKMEGYGLKTGSGDYSRKGNDDLGPNKELLQKKREEREAERRRIRERASTRQRISDTERASALEDMQRNAKAREEARKNLEASRPKNDDNDAPSKGSASFLTDISRRTHGITGESSSSLSARVAQNRHTNQRLHDSFF